MENCFLLLLNMVRNANSTLFQNNVNPEQVFPITVSQVERKIENYHKRSKTDPFEGVKIL